MIYLDANATTAVDPEVFKAMRPWLEGLAGNPSSPHQAGRDAMAAVERARTQLGALLHVPGDCLVFTSGGTEAIGTALASAVRLQPDRPLVLVSAIEHSATRESALHLVGAENLRVLPVNGNGRFDLDALAEILAADAPRIAVACLLWASNETGVLPGLPEAAAMLRAAGVAVHADAVQAVGKVPLDLSAVAVDMVSLSGHKFHAPGGVGALYLRPGLRFLPLFYGGGQQSGRRAGTENVAGIVGLGAAAECAAARLAAGDSDRIRTLRNRLEGALLSAVPGARRIGDVANRLANTSCLLLPGCPAAMMLPLLDEFGVMASSGAACTSRTAEAPRGLLALGLTEGEARATLRFSLDCNTSSDEVDEALRLVLKAIARIQRTLLPPERR